MPSNNGAPQSPLTVRALLQGKEAGSIIGKGGEVIKSFRDDSGARINIAAGTAMERMLTVSGATESVFQAFQLIMNKLSEQNGDGRGDLALRLVVPASQCGSVIGKGGAKIKELREETGAAIQVAKEMLPNSTDRTATVTGSADQIAHCVQLISYIMLESPPKGANIPYEPLSNDGRGPAPGGGPGGPGGFHGHSSFPPNGPGRNNGNFGANFNNVNNFNGGGGGPLGGRGGNHDNFGGNFGGRGGNNFGGNFGGNFNNPGNFGANFNQFEGVTTHEMQIPNEQAGSVIGKGGSRIAEIRQTTGATVTISKMEDAEEGGKNERTITIKGHSEQVAMAVYMINNR